MLEIPDPLFQEAVHAIDAGDVRALERLLADHPNLVRDRLDYGEGYFRRPYLLWFVAENPIRNGRLPENIVEVARTLLATAARQSPENFHEQIGNALGLVCSGKVPRECSVQIELIDLLVDAGADPASALLPALAHKENAAAERLLQRGAELTLLAAVCTGRTDEARRLAQTASPRELRDALAGAVLHRQTHMMFMLIESSVDVNAYNPSGFHAHGTALHHAVDSGSLGAVKMLVEAGADPSSKDLLYQGTPLDWAEHLKRPEIAEYLRSLKDEDINN
jgi:peptide-methionine (S)-S-oxide reductase